MANKRDTSRQRRARQNRAQREALAARTKAAQTPRPDRKPPAREASAASSKKRGAARGARDRTGADRRERRTPPPRLGEVPVDIDTLEGSWLRKVVQVPGGLQVVMAAVLVLMMTLMSCFVHIYPPEGAPRDAPGTRTIFDAYGARALMLLAPPVIIVGNALIYALSAKRRRMWTVSAVLMAAFSLFNLQFLFPAGFLGYAVLRSRKVEDLGGGRAGARSSRSARDVDDRETATEPADADDELDADAEPDEAELDADAEPDEFDDTGVDEDADPSDGPISEPSGLFGSRRRRG